MIIAHCPCYNNEGVISFLERTVADLFPWFRNNEMKANSDKWQLLLSTKEKLKTNISNYAISNNDKEKLLCVTINNHL